MYNSYGQYVNDYGILKAAYNKRNGVKAMRVLCPKDSDYVQIENCWQQCEHFNQVITSVIIKCDFGLERKGIDLNKIKLSNL